MKAIVKNSASPGLFIEDVEKPEPGPLDVIVKITKTSICGTDIHIYDWDDWSSKTIKPPMQIGHEWTGVVETIGSEVKKYTPGDRVSGEGHIVCGECRNCKAGKRHLCIDQHGIGVHLPGAFAEYFKIPATNLFKIPDWIPDNIATIFDPLGNAVHATLSYDLAGEDVLITGAGPIGIMSALIAKHVGARNVVITDINELGLEILSQKYGMGSVHEEKKAISRIIKNYIGNGGFLFAMCSATDSYDIALSLEGIDGVHSVFDGTPVEKNLSKKIDYQKTLAFKNFSIYPDPMIYEFSDIDFPPNTLICIFINC